MCDAEFYIRAEIEIMCEMPEKILCISCTATESDRPCLRIAWWIEGFSLTSNWCDFCPVTLSFLPHPEARISHIFVLILEVLSVRLVSFTLVGRAMYFPTPIPNKNRMRKTHRRNHVIKKFKQILHIPKVLHFFCICKLNIYEQFKDVCKLYIYKCLFFLFYPICSNSCGYVCRIPSGFRYCLNHGSIILGSQVDFWTLEDSVSSVRIHSAVFTHSVMFRLLYQKVVFIHCIHNLKSSYY